MSHIVIVMYIPTPIGGGPIRLGEALASLKTEIKGKNPLKPPLNLLKKETEPPLD